MKPTDGRWVTINGAHVFVKNGQSVEDALNERKKRNSGTSARPGSIIPGKGEKFKVSLNFFSDSTENNQVSRPKGYRTGPQTYVFPVGAKLTLAGKSFLFNKDIVVTDAITIVQPKNLREQLRISLNYGRRNGQWCKKAGNATVEISGAMQNVQVHWYENSDGANEGAKIIIGGNKYGESKIHRRNR